jgi:tetratricopeptide (TPR) repeat protein
MCRAQLPVWQSFYEKHKADNFQIVGIAMDAASPENARKFYQEAGVTFLRGVDRADALWATLGFGVVPNGIFLDEQGIVRYAKFGGFDARDAHDRGAIEHLLAAPAAVTSAGHPSASPAAPASPAIRASRQWFQRGVEALQKGDKKAAARDWRKALELDPKNFVIRKQIWALEHPEQFYPKINPAWQRAQMAQEEKDKKK